MEVLDRKLCQHSRGAVLSELSSQLDVTSSDQWITEQSAAILYRLLNENRVCPSLRLDARELLGPIVNRASLLRFALLIRSDSEAKLLRIFRASN